MTAECNANGIWNLTVVTFHLLVVRGRLMIDVSSSRRTGILPDDTVMFSHDEGAGWCCSPSCLFFFFHILTQVLPLPALIQFHEFFNTDLSVVTTPKLFLQNAAGMAVMLFFSLFKRLFLVFFFCVC